MKRICTGLAIAATILVAQTSGAVTAVVSDESSTARELDALVGAVNVAAAVFYNFKGIGLLNFGVGVFFLEDANSTLQFSKVTDNQAKKAGLNSGEIHSVNGNLSLINSLTASAFARAKAQELDQVHTTRLLDETFGANLNDETLSGLNKVRDNIASELNGSVSKK